MRNLFKPGFYFFLIKEIYNSLKRIARQYALKERFPNVTIEENVSIITPQNIAIGGNTIIQRNVVLHGGGMPWCENKGGISIGKNSCISPNSVIYGAGAMVTIGNNFDCGPGTKIFSTRTRYEEYTQYPESNKHLFANVTIGNDVVCFSNVVIGPGVNIGDGAVLAAGSVIISDVPANTVYGGVPAKFIKYRVPVEKEILKGEDGV